MPLTNGPAAAETLRDALLRAYRDNPRLTGERAAQRATAEDVALARAGGLPNSEITTRFQENLASDGVQTAALARQFTAQPSLTVPLYRGGGVRASIRAAEERVGAGRQNLRSTETEVFRDVVSAYLDVIRDEAVVALNTRNVAALEANARATRARFDVGDLTRTDVAQSEARLAQARARLRQSESQLASSREGYIALVGSPPGRLEEPPPLAGVPATPEDAVRVALAENPSLLAARAERRATRLDVQIARATRLPRVNATLNGRFATNLGSTDPSVASRTPNSATTLPGGLSVEAPLFQGGLPAARVRQAQARQAQAIEDETAAERELIARVRSSFAAYRSSLAVARSAEDAVAANQLSLLGVRAENRIGSRTVLDVLNAEQELLASQVTVVTARRDAYVAGFALLAAMGRAEASDLGLLDGPANDLDRNSEPSSMATSTADTPAQDASPARLPPDIADEA